MPNTSGRLATRVISTKIRLIVRPTGESDTWAEVLCEFALGLPRQSSDFDEAVHPRPTLRKHCPPHSDAAQETEAGAHALSPIDP